VESFFRAPYDGQLAFALYEAYKDYDATLENELMCQLFPLVRRTANRKIGKSRLADQGEYESDAIEDVLRIVRGDYLPRQRSAFTTYLTTVIERAFYDSIRRIKGEQFDYELRCAGLPMGTLPSHADTERAMYEQQIGDWMRTITKQRVRFLGNEHAACLYLLDCLLGFEQVSINFASRRFKLTGKRASYLIQYCLILIRASMLELRYCVDRKDYEADPFLQIGRGILYDGK
jgi:hypothetical protein